jgi:outer membrane receptor protein involved in Fe transport
MRSLPLTLCVLAGMAHAQTTASTPSTTQTPVQQSITVTADRGLMATDEATSTITLSQQQMENEPGLTLDDSLHQVAGFQLFRRTSSWTANPTTEGLSLRGLGSTAASRTLVVSDQVPLSDPFGGWVHWDELPTLAVDRVQLVRGGSADLYGSSAIGGVVEIVPVTPASEPALHLAVDALGATENTVREDMLLMASLRSTALLAAYSGLEAGGYVTTAPALRGAVDIPSNVHEESGRFELRTTPHLIGGHASAFLLGNVLNEARSNGTPDQTNGTRLWRSVGGVGDEVGATHLVLRGFGSREAYRQSFSAIAANRDAESLTKLQRVPVDEFGGVVQVARVLPGDVTMALGLDLRDVRATDDETAMSGGVTGSTTSTSARQRAVGGYVDAVWQPRQWSVSGSIRVDSFRTFSARQLVTSTSMVTPLPALDELFAGPRVGVVRRLPHVVALTGTAFRAFRGPTMNELYRTGQVGQQTTLANDALLAERATGFEFGADVSGRAGSLRTTYFWTEVNRPISAVLLSQTATTQLLERQNLGQIRSRGVMVEATSATWHHMDARFGYQLAVATVTAFNSSSAAQANLTGNWIPEVPRESATTTVDYVDPHVVSLHLIASYEGQEFDDAANQFVLHPYARFDAMAERVVAHHLSVFAGAQNLLNRSIDAGRTPILTLAAPRLVEGGLRYSFDR